MHAPKRPVKMVGTLQRPCASCYISSAIFGTVLTPQTHLGPTSRNVRERVLYR
jgi:hypothetical protein